MNYLITTLPQVAYCAAHDAIRPMESCLASLLATCCQLAVITHRLLTLGFSSNTDPRNLGLQTP